MRLAVYSYWIWSLIYWKLDNFSVNWKISILIRSMKRCRVQNDFRRASSNFTIFSFDLDTDARFSKFGAFREAWRVSSLVCFGINNNSLISAKRKHTNRHRPGLPHCSRIGKATDWTANTRRVAEII